MTRYEDYCWAEKAAQRIAMTKRASIPSLIPARSPLAEEEEKLLRRAFGVYSGLRNSMQSKIKCLNLLYDNPLLKLLSWPIGHAFYVEIIGTPVRALVALFLDCDEARIHTWGPKVLRTYTIKARDRTTALVADGSSTSTSLEDLACEILDALVTAIDQELEETVISPGQQSQISDRQSCRTRVVN